MKVVLSDERLAVKTVELMAGEWVAWKVSPKADMSVARLAACLAESLAYLLVGKMAAGKVHHWAALTVDWRVAHLDVPTGASWVVRKAEWTAEKMVG